VRGLLPESAFVQGVAENAEEEDSDGEGVAAVERITAGELGDCFVVVFRAGCGVPEGWVEDDGACRDCAFGSARVLCRWYSVYRFGGVRVRTPEAWLGEIY